LLLNKVFPVGFSLRGFARRAKLDLRPSALNLENFMLYVLTSW